MPSGVFKYTQGLSTAVLFYKTGTGGTEARFGFMI
jgi:hypothetical protein